MGQLLHMDAHPNRSPRHPGNDPLLTNIFSHGPHMRPCSQPQANTQTKRGTINPLRGIYLRGRGGPWPKTHQHGRNLLSPGTIACNIRARRSCPRKSPPPPRFHPPLHELSRQHRLYKRRSHLRPRLDRLILPPPTPKFAHTCARPHTRTLPNLTALGLDIEEGAVNWPTNPPLAFHRPGIGLVSIRKINSPYHTNISKSIHSSSVDTQIPLAGKLALATYVSVNKCK